MNTKSKVKSATKWTIVSSVTTAVVQMARLFVLARFLEKSDFGIVAIITFILGLTHVFSNLGFSSAIMHKTDLKETEFSSLYWIQFLLFLFIYFFIALLSQPIAAFYKESSIVYLLPIALLDLIFLGIGRLYDTLLQKYMLFKTLAIRNIVAALISLVVAVTLAYLKFGVYSLILSTLLHTLILNIWNFIAGQCKYKIMIYCSISEVKPLIKIGLYQTGSQLLDYLSAKLDVLIIGKFLGTEMLGTYNLAKELVLKIVLIINSIANRIALPFFSLLQKDNNMLKSNYRIILQILSFVNFPICAFTASLSPLIIEIVYGKEYSEVAPILSILSIWCIFVCIGNPIGNIIITKGRTDISFKYTLIRFALTIPIVLITSSINISTVAWGQVTLGLIFFFISWYMELWKLIGLKFTEFINCFDKTFILSITTGIIGSFVVFNNLFNIDSGPILQLICYGVPIVLIYVIGSMFFNKNTTKEIFNMIKQ